MVLITRYNKPALKYVEGTHIYVYEGALIVQATAGRTIAIIPLPEVEWAEVVKE